MVAPARRRKATPASIQEKTLPKQITILQDVPELTEDDAPIPYASPEVAVITKQGRKFKFVTDYTSAGGTYIPQGTVIFESDFPLGLSAETGLSRLILELVND